MAESALPTPPAKASLRERERELDARSSALDTHTDIGLSETLAVIRRVLVTFWPLAPVRLAVKALLQMGALGSVALLLPWQAKAVIDHVVLAEPIVTTGYPPYLHPVLHWLDGMHPLEILIALSTIAVGMVLTLGYYASGGARDDGVEAGMEQGHDIATATENDMNQGFSHNGGLWGFVEFTLQLRLSQAVNHVLRSQLFSRLAGLSMTRLEDQRIGDSVYRVMYDTPAVTTIFYEVVLTPTGSLTIYFGALVGLIGPIRTCPRSSGYRRRSSRSGSPSARVSRASPGAAARRPGRPGRSPRPRSRKAWTTSSPYRASAATRRRKDASAATPLSRSNATAATGW